MKPILWSGMLFSVLLLTACLPLGEPAPIAVDHAVEEATNARHTPVLETTMQPFETLGNGPTDTAKPRYVTDLETVYGAPSQAAFGSAVFYEPNTDSANLAEMALDKYKYFVGDLWAQYGEDAWMRPWKEVYARPPDATHDIVAELRAINDADAARSVPMILDNIDDAEQARSALSAAYDDPKVTDLRVFNLGDGGAMSGLLIAGQWRTGESLALVFLLD